jgi:hypothetical protein
MVKGDSQTLEKCFATELRENKYIIETDGDNLYRK